MQVGENRLWGGEVSELFLGSTGARLGKQLHQALSLPALSLCSSFPRAGTQTALNTGQKTWHKATFFSKQIHGV